MRNILSAVVVLALLSAAMALPARTQALTRLTPELVLGRILVHEASLPVWSEWPQIVQRFDDAGSETWISNRTGQPWGDDAYIVHEVLLRGAARHSISYVAYAQAYSGRVFEPLSDVERTRLALGLPIPDGNRWAAFVELSLERPEGWRSTRAWGRRQREALGYAFAVAAEVAQYDLDALDDFSPCAEPIDDWGGRDQRDHDHAALVGLVAIDCGPNAANTGYARPSQIRARLASGEWPREYDPE